MPRPSVTFACVLLLMLSGTVQAQLREFEITAVQNNRIQVFRDHPEMAAVIVNSSITNLRFDSNLEIVATLGNPNQGEYILIVRPVRQILSVNTAGYQQGRIQVSLTEPRQVAYYTVEPKPEVATNLIPTVVQITPADAIVLIDGNRIDASKPVPIEAGTHRLRIEKQGYSTIEKEVRISLDQNLIQETLVAIEVVPITIKTEPAGATVLLDGVQVGVTDRNGDIGLFRFPGTYELSVQLSGHVTETKTITVNETGPNATSINLIRNAGTLRLTVTPSDATVLLNRQPYNPSLPADLAPGMVLVEVSKPDHDPVSETVEIVRGQTVIRSIKLTPHFGGFQITPTPLQASWTLTDVSGRVVLSGVGLGRKTGVAVGDYTMTVNASGHQDQQDAIRIERDHTIELSVQLREGITACGTSVLDVEGNSYKTIQIGTQCWMAENLRTSKYQDGTEITLVEERLDWGRVQTASWSYYANSHLNNSTYGKLYNFYSVVNEHKLCPVNWHIPSDVEWIMMSNYLGEHVSHKLKSNIGWNSDSNGSNTSHFSALPGGYRNYEGSFLYLKERGYWWSASVKLLSRAAYFSLSANDSNLNQSTGTKSLGLSVRCIKD